MDKLDSVGELYSYQKPLPKQKKKKELNKVKKFSSLLAKPLETQFETAKDYAEEDLSQKFSEILKAIEEAGDELVASPTLAKIEKYRNKIRGLTRYLMEHVFGIEEKVSSGNILKRKKYILIKEVDKKLEELARNFLMAQKNQLDLLERVNEINGLVIDLIT